MKTVILAGGKGTRLKPYTVNFPKPLMPIGDMPILEIIVRQLKSHGLDDLIITVGHLSELIKAFFEDGMRFGVNIKYSKEDKPLGTIGCLSLIKKDLNETFLMINGDTLTTLNFQDLVSYHKNNGAIGTIALKKRESYIDFGTVEIDTDNNIQAYIEKPTLTHQVSMGVYVFEPKLLEYIEYNKRLDFPDLIQTLIKEGEIVRGYLFDDYWLDIGRPDDYEKAAEDYEKIKNKIIFIPE
ncbi:MAG: NTP transferase domain-containing protein [Dehalococcoidales bacterium]|nr:NTP transferase domain-containing protein [Dehalococcoidales bacterium]